ncbi:MAG: hypothetical protein OXE02_09445 [Chloroflexi bacterium]|nr:hypothetical protein [Chloroflexota bacterium]
MFRFAVLPLALLLAACSASAPSSVPGNIEHPNVQYPYTDFTWERSTLDERKAAVTAAWMRGYSDGRLDACNHGELEVFEEIRMLIVDTDRMFAAAEVYASLELRMAYIGTYEEAVADVREGRIGCW